jgi:hypothetical protein
MYQEHQLNHHLHLMIALMVNVMILSVVYRDFLLYYFHYRLVNELDDAWNKRRRQKNKNYNLENVIINNVKELTKYEKVKTKECIFVRTKGYDVYKFKTC